MNNRCLNRTFWDDVINDNFMASMLINTAYYCCISTLVGSVEDKILSLCFTAVTPMSKCKTGADPSKILCRVFYECARVCVTHVHTFVFCYSETFSFMLTGEDGSRRFGYCRRLLVSRRYLSIFSPPVHTPLSPVCCDRALCVNML